MLTKKERFFRKKLMFQKNNFKDIQKKIKDKETNNNKKNRGGKVQNF